MADRDSGDSLAAFLLGAVAGAALGLLFAPCSGDETRRRVASWLDEEREKAGGILNKERLGRAWEAGKQAFREATGSEDA